MKIKYKKLLLKTYFLLALVALPFLGVIGSGAAEAQNQVAAANFHILADDAIAGDCDAPGEELNTENCEILSYVVVAINILSALAVLSIIASIVIAGYQYMTARDNSGQIQKAKVRIIWALTALAIFVFMYAILDFLIPGGVI